MFSLQNIQLNNLGAGNLSVEVEVTGKYATSVYNGFEYRSGRAHPPFDFFIELMASEFNFKAVLAGKLVQSINLKTAFLDTVKEFETALNAYLSTNNSGYNTLNWWWKDGHAGTIKITVTED